MRWMVLALLVGCGDGSSNLAPDLSILPDLAMPDIATGYSCLSPADCSGGKACCVRYVGSAPMPAECSTTSAANQQCANGPNICLTDNDCPQTSPKCCFGTLPMIPPAAGTCLGPGCS